LPLAEDRTENCQIFIPRPKLNAEFVGLQTGKPKYFQSVSSQATQIMDFPEPAVAHHREENSV